MYDELERDEFLLDGDDLEEETEEIAEDAEEEEEDAPEIPGLEEEEV